MKKEKESGQTDANQIKAGNTCHYTGTNVLDRTLKNTPDNEIVIRGTVSLEGLKIHHRTRMSAVPFDVYRQFMESVGVVVLEDETC